jgi:Phosphoribosylformylglycinamidine (FGAM) synthase, glutamine amidotransferase domain
MHVPVAHGEGNYFANDNILKELEDDGRIIFRYAKGQNPNGSIQNIAGITNKAGNVVGMMPHPENATQPHQGNQSAKPFFEAIFNALHTYKAAA